VKFLLALGIDVDALQQPEGLTALHGAIQQGAREVITVLVQHGASLTKASSIHGWQALHLASVSMLAEDLRWFMTDVVPRDEIERLLAAKDTRGRTPLHCTFIDIRHIKHFDSDSFAALPAVADFVESKVRRVMVTATGERRVPSISPSDLDCFLRFGADVNARDDCGFTPLHYCALQAAPLCVKLLLDHDANPNVSSYRMHATPLHLACAMRAGDVIDVLIPAGADPRRLDARGAGPVEYFNLFPFIPAIASSNLIGLDEKKRRNPDDMESCAADAKRRKP
jgi:ankyrin repeat protein